MSKKLDRSGSAAMATNRHLVSGRGALGLLGALLIAALLTACGSEGGGSEEAAITRGLLSARSLDDGAAVIRGPDGLAVPAGAIPLPELGFNRGSSDAPVRVIELSDFGCGYCRLFHLETFPALREEFIETGMVEWKFLPYVTGLFQNSLPALRAAECGLEQSADVFEALSERLWNEQTAWKGSENVEPLVRGWALEAGAEALSFDSCMTSGRRVERIATAGAFAKEAGVRGTPTFIVLGYSPLQGALPLETFRQILHAVYRDATAAGD